MTSHITATKTRGFLFPKFGRARRFIWVKGKQGVEAGGDIEHFSYQQRRRNIAEEVVREIDGQHR